MADLEALEAELAQLRIDVPASVAWRKKKWTADPALLQRLKDTEKAYTDALWEKRCADLA